MYEPYLIVEPRVDIYIYNKTLKLKNCNLFKKVV